MLIRGREIAARTIAMVVGGIVVVVVGISFYESLRIARRKAKELFSEL